MITTNFYNTNATKLIDRYDNADMRSLHILLLKYIPKYSSVLDIGFGSGRDLQFLYENGYDIWGIDSSVKFIENAKNRFPTKLNQFFQASIPFNKEILGLKEEFDALIIIAMWMHLKHEEYENVVESIVDITSSSSLIIISYSVGNRTDEERYFEDVDLKYLTKLFESKGFFLIETVNDNDSLDRASLTWATVVFKNRLK